MNKVLREKLIAIAKEKITSHDPAHDIEHSMRVLKNAELIARLEKADAEIVVPAAIFHDVVMYLKNDPRSEFASQESAEATKKILEGILEYPQEKIEAVCAAIKVCSFNKGIVPDALEAKVLQDADMLDAVGAIAIMRTFSSTGSMQRPFYHIDDPFAKRREPQPLEFALDLFYVRLLKVVNRVHTKTAKKIAKRRTKFLKSFLKEFSLELEGR